ncbi:MAG: SBBP repeat-containing protein [Candidatus Thorarchaeota archaeon]
MKYIRVTILLLLLAFPLLSAGLNEVNLGTDNGINTLYDEPTPEDFLDGDLNLSVMFFTETPSSDNGLYYVCRSGTDAIAYFGVSSVFYFSKGIMVSLEFPGSQAVIPVGESPTGSVTNYLLGSDQESWKTNIADSSILRYSEIYPGIDLVYKIQDGNLKYEFVVKPYADASLIRMSYPDADRINIGGDSLTVSISEFSVSDTELVTFQGEERSEVYSSFRYVDDTTIGFNIGAYQISQVLFIDPLLVYSTFLGGSAEDAGTDIAVENGFIYVTGYTDSSGFPVNNAYNSTYSGAGYDIFVTKFSLDGQSLIYSTFLGGALEERAHAIAVEQGYVYITGYTYTTNFPLVNAYDSSFGGSIEAFLTKLSTDGQSIIYSTLLGGSTTDIGNSIDVEDGYAAVTGYTNSPDFPTDNAYNSTFGSTDDVFVTLFAPNGSAVIFSTYLGGISSDYGNGIAIEAGFVYVTGRTGSTNFPITNAMYSVYGGGAYDGFMTKFSPDGQTLEFSTFIGGTGSDTSEEIVVDNGYVYITGYTSSADFPTANAYQQNLAGASDAFLSKITNDGQSFIYSTYYGGGLGEACVGLAVENGYAYITGYTYSTNFPVRNAYDSSLGGTVDIFVSKFAPDGEGPVYSTYLGGVNDDIGTGIAVENSFAYVTGYTKSSDFPTVNPYDFRIGGTESDCIVSVFVDDSDMDGISDPDELTYGTNPFLSDSDNDNYNDAYEIEQGSDPLDAYSFPGATVPIDFALAYSSYLGGSESDQIHSVVVEDGFIYLAGITTSPNFPMVDAWHSTLGNSRDVFIVKMSDDGRFIVYSTFVGGSLSDTVQGMAVYEGAVFIAGVTSSTDFPLYSAYDYTFNGPQDGFLLKLMSNGFQPEFSTFFGGSGSDNIYDVYVEWGYAYITGATSSTDFPRVNAYNNATPSTPMAFLTKFDFDGLSLIYSTYLGGSSVDYGLAVAVENGYAYVGGITYSSNFPLFNEIDNTGSGAEGFLTKFSADGRSILFSSYLGGSDTDAISALSVERGFAWVTGFTESSDFPIKNAIYPDKLSPFNSSGFVSKVNIDHSTLVYSTYLTASESVVPYAISVEKSVVYVTGQTDSVDFPITPGQTYACDLASTDAFVTVISADGQFLQYSTCIGGSGNDYGRSVDVYDGRIYVGGYTESIDYPSYLAYNATADPVDDGFLTVLDIDSDGDSLPDFSEIILNTNVFSIDSDNDNFLDAYEVAYGSDPNDAFSYPAMPQTWYEAIYEDLNGNASLIQNLIAWSNGNYSLLETVIQQLDDNATLLTQVIAWLDGNHTAIGTLFTYLDGNATLLLTVVNSVNANSVELDVLSALISGNIAALNSVNSTHIEDFDELRAIINELGITVGDTDYDGLDDLDELYYGTDPLCIDTDTDNLNDAFEIVLGTDPLSSDSDMDTYLDGVEMMAGTDPLNPLSYPGSSQGTSSLDLLLVVAGIGVVVVVVLVFGIKKMKGRA